MSEERARRHATRQNLQQASTARDSLQALLVNIKENNLTLEEQVHSETLTKIEYEKEIEEHKQIWEAKYRFEVEQQMLSVDKQLEELKDELEDEKARTEKETELKKSAENKNEIYEKRSVQHQQEVSALRDKLKAYQRRTKEFEENNNRIPNMQADFESERQTASRNITKLKRQVAQLTEHLQREKEMRQTEETKQREQVKVLADLKANEKVQTFENERLERRCWEQEQQLKRQKDYYERNFLPVEEMDEFKKVLETKTRLDLNKKLQEVNMHLEEQLLAREQFDKLRTGIDRKTRTGFEQTVSQLKEDLTQVKTSLHEGLVERDTSVMEAQKFRGLFEYERNNSGRLADELAKRTDMLSAERSRTNYLFDGNVNKSKVTKKLFEESLRRNITSSPQPPTRLHDESNCSMYPAKLWNVLKASTPNGMYMPYGQVTPAKRRSFLS